MSKKFYTAIEIRGGSSSDDFIRVEEDKVLVYKAGVVVPGGTIELLDVAGVYTWRIGYHLTTPPNVLFGGAVDVTGDLVTEGKITTEDAFVIPLTGTEPTAPVDGQLWLDSSEDYPGHTTFFDTVGDGSSTSIAVTHNLNTPAIIVSCYEVSTNQQVFPTVTRTNNNTITLTFATAPATDNIDVVVMA